jgi:mRNA interferase MazF
MVTPGAPDRGDVVWLDATDQGGRRPAIVVSPEPYNRHGLALVCPITSLSRGYPFEVVIPAGHLTAGVILTDELRTVDWRARRAERTERIPDVVQEVLAKARTLLD